MSIFIKGMEMPESCDKCRFCVNGFTDDAPVYECAVCGDTNVSVLVDDNGKPFDFRPDWCLLAEIPAHHGRLVDLDKMIEDYWDASHMEIRRTELGEIPIIIEAEGSEE